MERHKVLQFSSWAMALLGLVMIVLGLAAGATILLPPVVTGIGFFIIAWAFHAIR